MKMKANCYVVVNCGESPCFGELLAKKKAAYPEYRKSRDEMRELLTAKANVEQILGITRKENLSQEKSK